MKNSKIIKNITIIMMITFIMNVTSRSQLIPNLGGQRVGISAYQFLKIGVGARASAFGDSYIAVANDASALFWNPAGLIYMEKNQVILSHTNYVVDIDHEFLGVAYKLTQSDVVGLSVISLTTPNMKVTNETNPFGNGMTFKYGDLAIGLTYSRQMTNQFSFGATVKYIEETLDVLKMRSVLVDFGTYYWTGLGSFRFGVVVTNFGSDVSPTGKVVLYDGSEISKFQKFTPPTLFKVGLAFEPYQSNTHRVTTSLQLNHPNDNAENIRFGGEYAFKESFFFRLGIKRTVGEKFLGKDDTSEEDISIGAGVKVPLKISDVNVDYAFTNFNRLGGVHRISLLFTF